MVLDELCDIPEPYKQKVARRYFSTQMHFEQTYRCCKAVGNAAKQLGIPVIIFKGPAIVQQGYVDTGARSFSDIDFFTDSKDSVFRLCEQLKGVHIKSSTEQHLFERMGESECVSFLYNNWELEFRYLLDPPGEPLFEFLLRNRETLLKVPGTAEDILQPNVSLHLVFLIQHMAVHHLFSRFFWFLDLAVLVRNNTHIDYDLVEGELKNLGLKNAAAATSEFCRKYIDPDFPLLAKPLPAWNSSMMKQLVDPDNIISGKFGIYHKNFRQKAYAYFVGLVSFYIIADPTDTRFGFGTHCTLNRFRNSFGVKKPIPWVDFLLRPIFASILLPLAWILSYMTCRERNKNGSSRK